LKGIFSFSLSFSLSLSLSLSLSFVCVFFFFSLPNQQRIVGRRFQKRTEKESDFGARVFSPARLSSLLHGLPRNFARPTLIARPIESGRKRKVRVVVRTKIHFRSRSRSLSSPLANHTEPLRGFFARLRNVRAMHSSNIYMHALYCL
jgi:hypothetical protein